MSTDQEVLKLREAAGNAPWKVLQCGTCYQAYAKSYEEDRKYPWALKLKCPKCHSLWWVCRQCDNVRSFMRTKGQAARHNRVYHADREEAPEREDNDATNMSEDEMSSGLGSEPVVEIPRKCFSRNASHKYFTDLQNNCGMENLVQRAVSRTDVTSGVLNKDDLSMFMGLSQFVATLSRTQRENLAEVLASTTETVKRQLRDSGPKGKSKSSVMSIEVPTTKQELRRLIWEGKHAVFNNLPHPAVREVCDHAYLLPSDCVADRLAHGIEFGCGQEKMEMMVESSLAMKITETNHQQGCKTIFVTLWSDDFEPNYSKGNRGSVWLLTMTIQRYHNPNLSEVYPLAVGPKGADHTAVTQIILQDLKTMEKRDGEEPMHMFDGGTKTIEDVSVHLLAVIQDQPERRGFAGLLLGGSGFHGRWGYSADTAQLVQRVPPCRRCLEYLESPIDGKEWYRDGCTTCLCWFARPENATKMTPPKNFPDDFTDQNGEIEMQKLTYALLKEISGRTHDKIVKGEWTNKEGKSYLSTYCFNTETRHAILEWATNCRVKQNAIADNNNELLQACTEAEGLSPEKFEKHPGLPMWEMDMSLQQSTEPCMHPLFLGIVKNITFEIQDWAALRQKYTNMRNKLELMTKAIESLHLSWCKVQPYKGEKLGGWVSENFVGFSRVLPWVYSCLEDLSDDEPYEPPGKPVGRWTVVECRDFLRIRRLSRNGRVKELRERVSANRNMPIPPPVGGPMNDVRRMLLMMWAMMSHLMGMTESSESEVEISEQIIRLFLTSVSKFDANMGSHNDRKLPIWVSQYNFTSLINLPEQIKILGPIRNRWEGGLRGEGFLRIVKPVVQSKRKNWQTNLLLNLLRQKTLKILRKQDLETVDNDSDEDDSREEIQQHQPQSFKTYDLAELYRDLRDDASPISCLVGREQAEVYCCFNRGRGKFLRRLRTVEGSELYHFGLWYFEWKLGDGEEEEADCELKDVDVSEYGLLLPLVGQGKKHALLTSQWRAIGQDGGACILPHRYLHGEFAR